MSDDQLLDEVRELEISLQQPAVRGDPARLDELLHDDFIEFGRSGRTYTKADVLESLPAERSHPEAWSHGFSLLTLADGVALLTYRSAQLAPDGALERHALRASVWTRTPSGWRVIFHQGTPTAPFDSDTSGR